MKKVLIFAYYWPPAGGVAVQRFLKFTRYLPGFGWKPIVVTPRNAAYQYKDESLAAQISPETEVHYTDTFEPFEIYNLLRGKKGKSVKLAVGTGAKEKSLVQSVSEYIRANYFIPDARKGWGPYAIKEAAKIIANQKIDALITTGPPHSAHMIGLALKKKYNIPWLADFRDPWSTVFYNNFLPRTQSALRKDQAIEAEVLKTADKIVLISKGMEKEFCIPVPSPVVIYNGFDEADFQEQPLESEGFFTLRYVGNFFATENAPALWRAIRKLLDTNAGFSKLFRFEITGNVDPVITEQIAKFQLDKWVFKTDFVPHNKAIQLMKGGNMLLLLFSNVPGNEMHMTGKMFEYIATLNPIIGFGHTSGDATKLLLAIAREPILDYENENGVIEFIQKYFNLWLKEKKRFQYTDSKYLMLSRKVLTKQLADTLQAISS